MKSLVFPVKDRQEITTLKAGDEVKVNGIIYTARDKAHQRLAELLSSGSGIPSYLQDSCIFYAGPAFFPDGSLSAIGPTTSARMDAFAPLLYKEGVVATIGKGPRSKKVAEACRSYGCLYLITYGGAAAYLTRFVKKIEPVEFKDFGPEAVFKLEVLNFPAIVAIDSKGDYLEGAVEDEF